MRTKGVGGLRQMRQPYDIICAALFAIHHRRLYGTPSICLRSLSAFYFCLFFVAFAKGPRVASSMDRRHRCPVHQPHQRKVNICIMCSCVCHSHPPTTAHRPLLNCIYMHACVICGWQSGGSSTWHV